jgi:hypothetical protein
MSSIDHAFQTRPRCREGYVRRSIFGRGDRCRQGAGYALLSEERTAIFSQRAGGSNSEYLMNELRNR